MTEWKVAPTQVDELKKLIEQANKYRDQYYNEGNSDISDAEYDKLVDKIEELENITGYESEDSPTLTVGFEVKSSLEKVKHEYPPMLSLAKTKEYTKVVEFLDGRPGVVMGKMDGLTCRLTYDNGILTRAETRGNGEVGEDITHNARVIPSIPTSVPYYGHYVVDGELIIKDADFEVLKDKFVDNKGKTYKNARNLAAGSARLLDSSKCAERSLVFVAWKLVHGPEMTNFNSSLGYLALCGFKVTPWVPIGNTDEVTVKNAINIVTRQCKRVNDYPIDGCVISFDDLDYLESLGFTSHHCRGQFAFKFKDDDYPTTLEYVDWTIGKTGVYTPTAVFEPVDIDGTEVSRASLHNLTIMENLGLSQGCSIAVYKANMIIPQVKEVLEDGYGSIYIPTICPECGEELTIEYDNESKFLVCNNKNCRGRIIKLLEAFVARNAMDIDNLGTATLTTLYDLGLVRRFGDIYELHRYRSTLESLEGMGKTSVNNILKAIEKSRSIKLENYLVALSIPNLGLATAKLISEHFNGSIDELNNAIINNFDFSTLPGLGDTFNEDIYDWWNENDLMGLTKYISFIQPEKKEIVNTNNPINGKTFCITGTFDRPRSEIQALLESYGGKAVSGVSKKTDFLFAGEAAGSKLTKAQELGTTIVIDYKEFLGIN
jgi:DNA ligase (NAD+)